MENIWKAIGGNTAALMTVIVGFIVIISVLLIIFLLKPGDEDRSLRLFGNELTLRRRNPPSNNSDEGSPSSSDNNNTSSNTSGTASGNTGEGSTLSSNLNSNYNNPMYIQNVMENFRDNFNRLIESFVNQLDVNRTKGENTITSMRNDYVNDTIQDMQFHFSSFFDMNDPQFGIKKEMFNLVITYEFNKIMVNKLKILEKNPQSSYNELNTMVDDASNDICKAIENKLDTFVIFSEQVSKEQFKNLFDSSMSLLSRKISEFLKSYVKKGQELKAEEQELIEENNKKVEELLRFLFKMKGE